MDIRGFQKVSLIDYPGKVAAVVFTAGCNFRCPYCYNRDLALNSGDLPTISEEKIFAHLRKRKGLIDGVVITGGEPTIGNDLPRFTKRAKGLGLLVKLDTNGSNPKILGKLLPESLLDYVALDVKAPLDERYPKVSNVKFNISSIGKSIKLVLEWGGDYELRTTVVPGLHSEEDLLDLSCQLSKIAPQAKWFLQNFQPKNCLDPEFEKIKPYDAGFFEKLLPKLRVDIPNAQLRQ